jgi:hypothetical protein
LLKEKTFGYRETLLETARRLLAEPVDPGLGLLGLFENSNWLIDRLKWLEKKTWKNQKLRIFTIFVLVCLMTTSVLPMAKMSKTIKTNHHAREVIKSADYQARQLNHEYIGTEHILLALIDDGKGVPSTILKNLNIDIEKVRPEIGKLIKSGLNKVEKKKLPRTPRAEKVMAYAKEEAKLLNHDCISTEHILLGLLRVEDGVGGQALINLGVKYEDVRQEVLELVGQGPLKGGHPTLVISGVVKDSATGQPIAGAKVGDHYYLEGIRSTVTRQDGSYSYLTWPEHHSIKAEASGYKTKRKSLYSGHFTFNKEMVEEVIDFELTPEIIDTSLTTRLQSLVKDFFKHNYRDITSRRTIEWGQPKIGDRGNMSIRYKYEATIWDKDKIITDQLFVFDKDGKLLSYNKISPFAVGSKQWLQEHVEEFFKKNYRDITAKKTIEWGEPQKNKDGTYSINYKYEATIWNKNKIVQNKKFTFDKDGKFIKVLDVASSKADQNQQSQFSATLPNGVTVELVGVCEHPSEGKQWWQPDGTPFNLPAELKIKDNISRVGDNAYQFLFRYNSQEDLAWDSLDAVCLHFSIEGHSFTDLINMERLPKNGQDGLVAKIAIFKEPLESTTIQANLATGNWQTKAVRDISKIDQRSKELYWFTSETPGTGNVSLDILHKIEGHQIKKIAIDREGNEYKTSYSLGSFGGWMPTSIIGAKYGIDTQKDKRRYHTSLQKDDRLVKFKLQSRPFWSSVIGNVSLKPNFNLSHRETDVKIEVEKQTEKTKEKARIRVAGKVVDKKTGKGIGGAWIHFVGAPDDNAYTYEDGSFSTVADRGRFHQCLLVLNAEKGKSLGRIKNPVTISIPHHISEELAQNLAIHIDPDYAKTHPNLKLKDQNGDGIFCDKVNCKICSQKTDVQIKRKKGTPIGNYALEFDGIDDFMEIHASKSLQLGRHFTIQMWVKPDFPDTSTPDKDRNLLSKGSYVLGHPDEKDGRKADSYGFGFRLRPKDNSTVVLDMSTANNGIYSSTNFLSYKSGWMHLVISSRENRGRSRGINYIHTSQEVYQPAPNSNIFIGKNFLIPMGNPFKGQIAELRIWNRELSFDEIAQFKTMALSGNEPNLVGCWTFEQTESQRVIDISPYKNRARLGSSPGPDDADPEWINIEKEE